MSVRKRGHAWEVRLEVGGREIRRSAGVGSTRADAIELQTQIRRGIVDAKLGRAPKKTIAEAIERWLDGEAKVHKDARSDDERTRRWLPYIEGRLLTDAVAVAAEASDAWLAEGLKPATINRRIALLRRVCRLAHSKWKWLPHDISRELVALPGERERHTFLTRKEVMALVHAAPRPLADAILLAAYTGLRQGELLRLTKADVKDGCVVVRDGKSKASLRSVPVPPAARSALKRLPVPYTVAQLDNEYRKVRKAVGLPHVRWHDLRHTYGSWLGQSGAAPIAIRDAMGHSTLAMTSRYTHTAPEHVRRAVAKLK